MYNDRIQVRFNEGSHRYTISKDNGLTWDYKPGVTTILKTLSKEALMLWPMDEALKLLFGQEFAETVLDDGSVVVKPVYVPSKALIKPDGNFSPASLQSALEAARMAHTTKRDKGGDIGHEVHQIIENYLKRTMPSIETIGPENQPHSKEAQKAFDAFADWFEKQKIKVINTERVVYSEAFDYCGTYDALFEIDGKLVLVDFKTSNASRTAPQGIYPEAFLQLGAYALAYEEEFKQDITDLMVVNCSKQGKVNTKLASELGFTVPRLQNLFTSTLNLHKGIKSLEFKLKEKK